MDREDYMRIALEEAKIAYDLDEVPIGAIIVHNDEVIARAHNMKEHDQLASSHAEVLAIQKASQVLGTWNLKDCDLYVTLEPCMMCTGMISHARIQNVFYGTDDPKGGAMQSLINIKMIPHVGTYPKMIYKNILQEECAEILRSFFRKKRLEKKEQKATN